MRFKINRKIFFRLATTLILLFSGGRIFAETLDQASGDLIINEILATNGTGLTDEDGDSSDWIEIYNRGNSAINLAGWALTDDPNQPQKWPFPDMSLGSHQYLIVFASGKDRTSTEPGTFLHTNFKLSKTGDFLALHNVLEGKFFDTISPQYPEQFRDVSFGRYGEALTFGYLAIPTPGGPNDESIASTGSVSSVSFSVGRGIYEAPFMIELTTDTSGATIRYTTDGSEPTESNGAIYTEPIPVQATSLLRAIAFKPGFLPSGVNTQTYIFVDDVLTQFSLSDAQVPDSRSGIGILPAAAGFDVPPKTIDIGELKEGLKSIPSISLMMDPQSLTDFEAHPDERGKDSERAVSFELFYPDSDEVGTQIDAGLRPYGEILGSTPKQSYRLVFRGKYGSTKLEYPLFSDSPLESFDTLVLQASVGNSSVDGAYARNEWLRTSQVSMSGLGAHGMFVNLYLNGQYVGLYNLIERPDMDFMAAYLGGQPEDWFVANQAGPLSDDLGQAANELNYLYTALALAPPLNNGPTQPGYLADTYAAAVSYLDPAELTDYMLLNWYADTLGWPQSSWYAAVRLQDLPGRGKLVIGDEQVSFNEQIKLGQSDSSPRNVHQSFFDVLMQDADFRVKFADRLYQHLFNGGALTDTRAQARWQQLNATIDQASWAEATLWANVNNKPTLTRADWLGAQGEVLAQIEGNAARLVAQAREAGYYPDFDPPVFSQDGGLVEAGFTLEMSLPTGACENCIIYYTTDRSDPRLPFTGAVIPNAVAYSDPLVLTANTQVKARVWNGQAWSALHEAAFSVVEQDNKLRITEIMYNPANGDDYEFVELKNSGNSELDLAGISLVEGVRFTFPPNTPPLKPGGYAVLVSNPPTFAEQYPDVPISGAYEGHLSNKGEQLILQDSEGQILMEVVFADDNGWPISADGRGDSLILINEAGNPSEPKNWRASIQLYGSPGQD